MLENISRRGWIVGGTSIAVGVPLITNLQSRPAFLIDQPSLSLLEPIAFQGWLAAFTAGLAANWFAEVLKNLGMVPGNSSGVSGSVENHHAVRSGELGGQGFDISDVFAGTYAGGDIVFSGARRSGEFRGLGTSEHGAGSLCTMAYLAPDICALHAITNVLDDEGVDANTISACALPVHGDYAGSYSPVGHTRTRRAETHDHGSVSWSTSNTGSSVRVEAEIHSADLNASLVAEREGRAWKYRYDRN